MKDKNAPAYYAVAEGGRLKSEGLTIREVFVAAALQGILASDGECMSQIQTIPEAAIDYADETLKLLGYDA